MSAKSIRDGMALSALLGYVAAPIAAPAQENCTPVHFERGKSSAVIRGISPPDAAVCYTFAAAAGQTASLKVTGNNMIISVIDVGDARDAWTFTTKARTYKFIVGQFMRSVTNVPYAVTLSIR